MKLTRLLLVSAFLGLGASIAQASATYDLLIDGPGTSADVTILGLTLEGSCEGTGDFNSCVMTGSPAGGGADPTDWFSWVALENGNLQVDLLFTHAQMDIDLGVYDASPLPTNAIFDFIAGSFSITDNESVILPVTAGIEYLINPYSFLDFDAGATYVPDSFETNNSPSTAASLSVPEPTSLALLGLGLAGLGFTRSRRIT